MTLEKLIQNKEQDLKELKKELKELKKMKSLPKLSITPLEIEEVQSRWGVDVEFITKSVKSFGTKEAVYYFETKYGKFFAVNNGQFIEIYRTNNTSESCSDLEDWKEFKSDYYYKPWKVYFLGNRT